MLNEPTSTTGPLLTHVRYVRVAPEHQPVVHVVPVLHRNPELARLVVNGFNGPTETHFYLRSILCVPIAANSGISICSGNPLEEGFIGIDRKTNLSVNRLAKLSVYEALK